MNQTNSLSISHIRYCSQACGRRLARNRLLHILPQRIDEWNATPTVADEQARLELDRIRTRMEQARDELQALGEKLLRAIETRKRFLTVVATD